MKEKLAAIENELKELKAKQIRDEKLIKKKSKKQEKKDFLMNLQAENNVEQFECDKCDAKMTTIQNLKTHLRIHHLIHSSSQTDDIIQFKISDTMKAKSIQTFDVVISEKSVQEFESYQCFYCRINIESKSQLKEHKKQCNGDLFKFNIVKSTPVKASVPQIGFPPVGFSSVVFPPIGFSSACFPPFGFPSINSRCSSPFYSPVDKITF